MNVQRLPIGQIDPHPKNPRVFMSEDRVSRLAELIARDGFADCHAILVRPSGDRFEVISGHHRRLAAISAGLETVPCWVVEMSDAEAHDQLRMQNDHGELDGLEEGRHIYESVDMADIGNGRGNVGGLRDYCRRLGLKQQTEQGKMRAWMVAEKMTERSVILLGKAAALELIARKAPDRDWGELATEVMANDLSYREVERMLSRRYSADQPTTTPEPEAKTGDVDGLLNMCAARRGVSPKQLLAEIIRDWVEANFPDLVGEIGK